MDRGNLNTNLNSEKGLSFFRGPSEPELQLSTIGNILQRQAIQFPGYNALIVPNSSYRATYQDLNERTQLLCRAMIASGVHEGDRIGLFAGNTSDYVEIFLAATRIGAIAVLLNTSYTFDEVQSALYFTGSSMLFISESLGKRSLSSHIKRLESMVECHGIEDLPELREVIVIPSSSSGKSAFQTYEAFLNKGLNVAVERVVSMEAKVTAEMTCNFQFTSGTTGTPKIAMLSHFNVINNGFLIGDRIRLVQKDIICCPVPLFHAAGLVLGLIGCLTHGSTLVLPCPTFEANTTADILVSENCTGVHTVPTIFAAILESYSQRGIKPPPLRTGTLGGAPVSPTLLKNLQREFGIKDLGIGYGMTETSPLSYVGIGPQNDPTGTWLQLLPHTLAKIKGPGGEAVPIGSRGELCIAGYLLQKGYYRNAEKTKEAMRFDSRDKVVWMHTGDEAIMDEQGQCRITGRIKDIIIRGGENIYPAEIEERLNSHPGILMAAVVGVNDAKYGQAVTAFLQPSYGGKYLSRTEIQEWVKQTLGRYKVPTWIFYMGVGGVPDEFPKTASGKIKKIDLMAIGARMIKSSKI